MDWVGMNGFWDASVQMDWLGCDGPGWDALVRMIEMGWNEWLLRCIGANGWAGMRQSEWLGVDTLA